jgi:hypothetical protein
MHRLRRVMETLSEPRAGLEHVLMAIMLEPDAGAT